MVLAYSSYSKLIMMSLLVTVGVTVVKKCDSPMKVCQLVGRCDGHREK